MDLFCPHCTRRVTVPDDKAGQVASCPLCAKQFMAPALAPTPAAPKPPAPAPAPPPVETFELSAPQAPASPPRFGPPTMSIDPPPTTLEPMSTTESPPPPPGEYTRTFTLTLSDSWLSVVPVVCVVLIFVLSFFTWHSATLDADLAKWAETSKISPADVGKVLPDNPKATHAASLWGLSFSIMQWQFMAYTIFMFLIGVLVIAGLLLDKGLAPPALVPFTPWKSLAIGLLLGLTFLLLLVDFAMGHLASLNPIALAEEIAVRLHFLAMLASFGMFWLHWRKKSNLPLPKADVRL
jgi:hypothetical protein